MARRTECDQPIEIEVRAPLGPVDDVVDLDGAPAAEAWHRQRARRNNTRRIAAHSSRVAAGRPVARGPPSLAATSRLSHK
jgi:hypothetical protein